MDKQYVVVKLVSGETVMATFEGEDKNFIKIDHPINIRTTMIPELGRESISASPLCQFTDATEFVLEKSHIIYIKKLHAQFIPHYKNFLKSYEEALIPASRASIKESLEDYFDDAEDLTVEEINRRLDMLEAIANSPSGEDTEDETPFTFIDGNETIH